MALHQKLLLTYIATIYIFNYLFVHNVVDDSITTFCQTDNEG